MVEILWKSQAPHYPSEDQEICELRLVDLGNMATPQFMVREIHASWSAAQQQIRWNGFQDQACWTREQARRSYESLRASIVDAGFAYTSLVA
jgi:hypothetical protein